MKEATGEFSMTVVTILAVCVIAGLVAWLGPKVSEYVGKTWNSVTNSNACEPPKVMQPDGTCK